MKAYTVPTDLSDKDFQILEALDSQEIMTQRQLSAYAGISLGQVNYLLKGLIAKGFVKIGNFNKNPNKIRYTYLLTPKGIETKSKLAVRYVIRRLKKYHNLRNRMFNRLEEIEKSGYYRILFIGPSIVNEFVVSTIMEMNMKLNHVGHLENWQDLKNMESDGFDIALIFDSDVDHFKIMGERTGVDIEKFQMLW